MQKYLKLSALVLTGAVCSTPAAHANGTYNDGDLFLGFRSSDSNVTNDFFVDIGQPDQFETATPGSTITLGNFNADLSAVFGSNTFYSSTTLFSVTGAVSSSDTSGKDFNSNLFTTVPVGSALFPAKPDSSQGTSTGVVAALGIHWASAPQNGASTSNGVIESTGASNSYRSFQPGGNNSGTISFQTFTPSNENAITATGVKLEELLATDDGPNGYGQGPGALLLGTVNVSSAGVVTFTAVPEPGSATLLAFGTALGLGFYRRRRLLLS